MIVLSSCIFKSLADEQLKEIFNCTACGQQVNHFQRDSVFQHPALHVLICKVETRLTCQSCQSRACISLINMHAFFLQSCFKYYMSDDISKDEDGMDEQCRLVQNICFITL